MIVGCFLPRLLPGSGGIRTVLSKMRLLRQRGWEVVLPFHMPTTDEAMARTRAVLAGYDLGAEAWPVFPYEAIIGRRFDAVLATSWQTTFNIVQCQVAGRRVYFVQDYEPLAYPAGHAYLQAWQSYTLGFHVITLGGFVADRLRREHGLRPPSIPFGVDPELYHPGETAADTDVAMIFQPLKDRRCTGLGITALQQVAERRPDVRITLYGANEKVADVPFVHAGLIRPAECGALYRRSRVGLCFSASNPSRVGFEMMACGLPVVEVDGPSTAYDFPPDVMLRSKPWPDAVAAAVLRLLDDAPLRDRLRRAALDFMRGRTLAAEDAAFADLFEAHLRS